MKKKRFKEEQIIAILQEAEAGAKVPELARKRDSARQLNSPIAHANFLTLPA